MTPDEISAIMERLDKLEETVKECTKNDAAFWRMLYILLGVALGSGALQLSQVVI